MLQIPMITPPFHSRTKARKAIDDAQAKAGSMRSKLIEAQQAAASAAVGEAGAPQPQSQPGGVASTAN